MCEGFETVSKAIQPEYKRRQGEHWNTRVLDCWSNGFRNASDLEEGEYVLEMGGPELGTESCGRKNRDLNNL